MPGAEVVRCTFLGSCDRRATVTAWFGEDLDEGHFVNRHYCPEHRMIMQEWGSCHALGPLLQPDLATDEEILMIESMSHAFALLAVPR